MKAIVAAQPNRITKQTTISMIQKNTINEKKENTRVVRQTTNNEGDERNGRNEKAQKNRIQKIKINIATALRTAQYM